MKIEKQFYHEILKRAEGQKLIEKGYTVEYEKFVAPHWRADVVGTKEDKIVIIECGYFQGHNPTELFNIYGDKLRFFNVKSLQEYLPYWESFRMNAGRFMIQNMAQILGIPYTEMLALIKEREERGYDWTEYLKEPYRTQEREKLKEPLQNNI